MAERDNRVINEIKQRINIVDLISNYVSLKKRGSSYIGLCPFHNEKTGSFNVNPTKGFYHCFGCGESGDIFTFIQKYENVEFFDALKFLAEKAGIELETDERKLEKKSEKDEIYLANGYAVQFYKEKLKESPEGLSYLSRRGVTQEIIDKFSLGFSPDGWNGLTNYLNSKKVKNEIGVKAGLLKQNDKNNVYDMFRNRVMFPIWTSFGKPIGFGGRSMGDEEPKYLNTSETPVFNKGREFYALNFAKESISKLNQVIIVEGYMDVIACHSNGINNAIAVLGTALTKEHIDKISKYTQNIVLCFDADKAGIKAALRSGEMFFAEGIRPRVATTPKGEDPDSFLQSHSQADFLNIIDKAIDLLDFEINVCLEKYDLSKQDDKINALTECCKIVAKEPNAIRRESFLNKLLPLHPNPQSSNAQNDIRDEINKYVVGAPKYVKPAGISKAKEDKYIKTQKMILAGMVGGVFDLNDLLDMDTEDFAEGFNRYLFTYLKESALKGVAPDYEEIENAMREKEYLNNFIELVSIDESLYADSFNELVEVLRFKKNKGNLKRRQELEEKLAQTNNLSKEELEELMLIIRGR